MASIPAFLNGKYLPLEECTISVLDRGFIFGDGIYELLTVYNNKPFRIDQHLARLVRSLAEVKIENPYSENEWRELITTLTSQSETEDLVIYIQVSRGAAPRDHFFPDSTQPTVFAMANILREVPKDQLENGVATITCDDMRWQRCDIKVTSLLANILAKQEASEANAIEAILVRDDYALEGSASNLFVVREGIVYTHPKDNLILPGITRDFVLELLQDLGIEYREQAIPKDWLYTADELWITSSTKEVLAATRVDNQPVANNKPGPLWAKTYDLFQQRKY